MILYQVGNEGIKCEWNGILGLGCVCVMGDGVGAFCFVSLVEFFLQRHELNAFLSLLRLIFSACSWFQIEKWDEQVENGTFAGKI